MVRILVVDDDANVRSAISRLLKRAGVIVEEAGDGNEAIRAYTERPADLVLCDLMMPGVGGLEIIRELTNAFPDARVVAMSGYGLIRGAELLDVARDHGALGALEKPFNQAALLTVLNRLIPNFSVKLQPRQ